MIIESPLELIFRDLFYRLRAFAGGNDVFLKLEGLNVTGSIKIKTAIRLIEEFEQRSVDTLYMIEVAASYFFRRALEPRKGRKAEQIDQDYRDAAHLAVLAAPFRHSKLTATKILGDPNNPGHFRDDATAEELRAEIMKRLEILTSAGLIDLQALPAPSDGIVKRPKRSVDHAGINGE